jgi:hypothetical protein
VCVGAMQRGSGGTGSIEIKYSIENAGKLQRVCKCLWIKKVSSIRGEMKPQAALVLGPGFATVTTGVAQLVTRLVTCQSCAGIGHGSVDSGYEFVDSVHRKLWTASTGSCGQRSREAVDGVHGKLDRLLQRGSPSVSAVASRCA